MPVAEYSTEKKPTIFIIDPDETHCLGVVSLLEKLGYCTMTFASAEDFLGSLSDPILRGCVVSEMKLPGINGLELLTALRERAISLPFIVLTSDPDVARAVTALRSKVANYLVKPFVSRDLAHTIETALIQPESANG